MRVPTAATPACLSRPNNQKNTEADKAKVKLGALCEAVMHVALRNRLVNFHSTM